MGNQIRQCAIRDHYDTMKEIIIENNAKPIDSSGEEALKDENYYNGMIKYENEFAKLVDPIWEKEYINPEKTEKEADNLVLF